MTARIVPSVVAILVLGSLVVSKEKLRWRWRKHGIYSESSLCACGPGGAALLAVHYYEFMATPCVNDSGVGETWPVYRALAQILVHRVGLNWCGCWYH